MMLKLLLFVFDFFIFFSIFRVFFFLNNKTTKILVTIFKNVYNKLSILFFDQIKKKYSVNIQNSKFIHFDFECNKIEKIEEEEEEVLVLAIN